MLERCELAVDIGGKVGMMMILFSRNCIESISGREIRHVSLSPLRGLGFRLLQGVIFIFSTAMGFVGRKESQERDFVRRLVSTFTN